ncbi:MAG: hypothetical protein MJ002_08110 [Paludibacteraceae bacterium]|nr:hypothetical protein [Paludibacteraceae bacterium]
MVKMFSKGKRVNKKPLVSAVNVSYYGGVVLYVVACIQTAVTLSYPVSKGTSVYAVYSRNVSAILMFVVLGAYMTFWGMYKRRKHHSKRTMKKFRIMTIIVIVGCIVKTFLAICYTAMQATTNGFSWVYYLGEAIAWACLSVFFVTYLKSKHVRQNEVASEPGKHHHHHKTESELKMEEVGKNH